MLTSRPATRAPTAVSHAAFAMGSRARGPMATGATRSRRHRSPFHGTETTRACAHTRRGWRSRRSVQRRCAGRVTARFFRRRRGTRRIWSGRTRSARGGARPSRGAWAHASMNRSHEPIAALATCRSRTPRAATPRPRWCTRWAPGLRRSTRTGSLEAKDGSPRCAGTRRSSRPCAPC